MTILGLCMLLIGAAFPPEAQGRKVCEINGIETTDDTTIFFELPNDVKTAKQLSKWMRTKRSFQCASLTATHNLRMFCIKDAWGLDIDQSPLSIQMLPEHGGFYINVTED